ncbi:hypothetical protein QWY28_16425 [Nocardioides sp. SOB77]|uniref:Uncharacterized protein n=1 Tax=Nocardioides oceani TaxID=3058369 RepID=A0ABT8FIN8_9ACTN|nr:hypothetical protein [Nocardioides oceani]MDN4174548.1 hypothetical protein [Nocardioides oceani]
MRFRLAVALALTLGCGAGLSYADGQAPARTAAEPALAPPAVSGEIPTFGSTDPVPPSLGLYPPPVVADVSPGTAAPPQLVFPSSYTAPDIAPTTSYVPPADHTSAPSGAPSPPSTAGGHQSDHAFESAEPSPAPQQPSGDSGFEPGPAPQQPQPTPQQPQQPTPQPQPQPTPQPEPEPVADPCADALALEWTCEVDEDAAPTDPATVEDEEALLELVPEEADGAAYELVLDLGGEDRPVIVVGTSDLTREALVAYLATVRETRPDAALLSVAGPATDATADTEVQPAG